MTGNKGCTTDEGADTPLYLALLPRNTTTPKGNFVGERAVMDWHADAKMKLPWDRLEHLWILDFIFGAGEFLFIISINVIFVARNRSAIQQNTTTERCVVFENFFPCICTNLLFLRGEGFLEAIWSRRVTHFSVRLVVFNSGPSGIEPFCLAHLVVNVCVTVANARGGGWTTNFQWHSVQSEKEKKLKWTPKSEFTCRLKNRKITSKKRTNWFPTRIWEKWRLSWLMLALRFHKISKHF